MTLFLFGRASVPQQTEFPTEKGYYYEEVEKILNDRIEQPFSKLLQYIDEIDFDSNSFILKPGFNETTKQFMNGLLARNPNTFKSAKKNSKYLQLYGQQAQHDLTVITSINEAVKMGLFDEYYPTFTVNRTEMPFVLPICGFYWYNKNKNIYERKKACYCVTDIFLRKTI